MVVFEWLIKLFLLPKGGTPEAPIGEVGLE